MKQFNIVKKMILLAFIAFFNVNVTFADDNVQYDKLIDAIATIESSHNPLAVSRDGSCVGYLQIKTVCVRECNRILGYQKYTYADRKNKQKSIEMFMIIQKHYNPEGKLIHGIRLWNEGPFYNRKKDSYTRYVREVLKIYNKLIEPQS